MSRKPIRDLILEAGIVPIVRVDSAEQALNAARAVLAGGIPVLEVTMTVPGALRVLEKLADETGDQMTLGAGTVLDPETARASMLAGAQFFVSPAVDLATIEICKRYSKAAVPGAFTPTEVLAAWNAGADLVKIFPVENAGGPSYIKALKAPLPQVLMAPTGGVTLDNAADYLRAGASVVAVGSELVSRKAVAAGDYAGIEAKARRFREVVEQARRELEAK